MYRGDKKKEKKRRNWQRALIVTGLDPREVPLFISLHTRYPRPWEKLQAERPMSNDQCRWLSNRLAVPIDPSKRASLLIVGAKNKFANISAMKTERNESQYTLNARHAFDRFVLNWNFLYCENTSENVQ